ncbi:heptaprenylglyceryl phosphate synthase [Effusibacillus lacus]|uniref:Geranylgeranylglyceryl/heptaprenylglyceryl phosphate synthase n=1 Tax=Effusibacillus lacus TaxID=1348429 RepID=A0A292YPM2_9BACL|nr:heptaprenylglyceryl phosphate synthase [Effusibacillus lacus]TCS76792.1 putative glycerol-1-phosphate prenyltransferase [Effusibacillus lacus]GAX91126.1 geranylgeranylglyceryl/heptaprenylglyceryl phosphate synthase [Effusibacillus lacus]
MSALQHPWSTWRHVVKLDPDKEIGNDELIELGRSGTDAVLVGGTQGITYEKSFLLIKRLHQFAPDLCVWQEISDQHAVVQEVDGFAIPVVLNAGSAEWIIGRHIDALERFGSMVPWQRVVPEGYVILNPEAAAARLTGALCSLSPAKVIAYVMAAERILGMSTIYLEYSGIYGDPKLIRQVRQISGAHLVYGGGIDSVEKAVEMAEIVDTIVVGNAIYDKGIDLVRETVLAVRSLDL